MSEIKGYPEKNISKTW